MAYCKTLTAYLGFALVLLWHSTANAKSTFNFAVNSPGSPPYLYIDAESQQYTGLIVDVLTRMAEQQNISVKFIDSHRNRTESLIYQGLADGTLSSSRWLTHPEKLISTIGIVDHKSFVYSMSEFTDNFALSDLYKSRVCMRRGYVYPAFSNNSKLQNIVRVDSSDQLSMMHMLAKDRCTFAILHEYNANRIIASQGFKNVKIYRAAQPHDVAELAIFLRPELSNFKLGLDLAITAMQSDGSLAASLNLHMSDISAN